MANIKKISKVQIYNLLKHNNREKDDGVQHSNESIDPELTPLNYHFKKTNYDNLKEMFNKHYSVERDNQIKLLDIVVTLPQDVKEEDEWKFFNSCYEFYCKDFGWENVANAVVHKDEITPHLHLDIIPVKELDKANMSEYMAEKISAWEKEHGMECTTHICCKEVVTRDYLRNMHPRLLSWVTKDLGYQCEILNGATDGGNRTVLQLKNSFLEEEVTEKQEQLDILNKNIQFALKSVDEVGLDPKYCDVQEILNKLALMKQELAIYKEELFKRGVDRITLPESYLAELRKSQLLGSNFTVRDGILVPDKNIVTLVEIPKEIKRPYPVMRLIRNNPELRHLIEQNRYKEIERIDIDEMPYMVFPTDNHYDTFSNLIALKKRKDIDCLAMTGISNDTFNLAENIMRTCDYEVNFYLLKEEQESEYQRQQEFMRTMGLS